MGSIEQWLPVVDYEGLYEISSRGRLKRLKGYTISIREGYKDTKILRPEKILKPAININGYLTADLHKYDGSKYVRKPILLHRLVAEAFIGPPPKNKENVIFLNGNKKDLSPDNLKWGNNSEAQINARKVGTRGPNTRGWDYFDSIPVNQLDLITGEVIDTHGSYGQATEKTGIPHQNIRQVIRGKRKSAGGYFWELYKEDN